MFSKFKNENFIQKYSIDKSVTRGVIKFFDKSPQGMIGKKPGKVGHAKLDTEHKDSTDMSVLAHHILKSKVLREYFEQLTFCIEKYKKKYIYSDDQQAAFRLEGANIQKYKPGQGYKLWHYENAGCEFSGKRHLVFMTYLNNADHAGTEFYHQNKRFKCKEGDTLIWPAAWTHTHRGEISKKQKTDKYIITGWWRYD